MGVRGLQTFLECYCPSACYHVKIAELVKNYITETGNEAVIVIDAQSCYSLWYKNMDWIIGIEIQEFLYRLRTFVESFEKIGAKIVFFFGGLTVEKKRRSWINRRIKNLREVYDVFNLLKEEKLTKNLAEKYASLPPAMGLFTSMLLKYVLNCEVYMTIEECDEEIIEYAHKNNCLAIFAQDSDYVVSNIQCKVLSSKNFNENDMTTLIYDREVLAKILLIRVDQLPLLGILAGNDVIEFENLRGFHCSICNVRFETRTKFDVLMPAIGRYINNLPEHRSIDELLEMICVEIFGDASSVELMKSSYNGYLIQNTPKIINSVTNWDRILQIARHRHRTAIVPCSIYGILKNHVYELAVTFEDLRRTSYNRIRPNSFISSATVTRLLRQRMYGILLHEYEHSSTVKIREWCGENTDSYQHPVLVTPVPPIAHHPGLLQLWSDNNSDRYSRIKWKLFLSSISPNIISITEWCSLTEDLVAISATLFYLFEEKFINKHEMNAVIATVATYSLYSREKLEELCNINYHPKCTHISVSVIRTFSIVIQLMAACGYPVPLSGDLIYMKFEAKLFQLKFMEMKQKMTIEEMCENDDRCIGIFDQMMRVLNRATRNSFERHNLARSSIEGKEPYSNKYCRN